MSMSRVPELERRQVVEVMVGTRHRVDLADRGPGLLASPMALLIALHVLAAVLWVGGMAFAYLVLRPSAGPLATDARLQLWQRVFSRFFPLVWASIVVLLISGFGMILFYLGG